ncbi:unnamed protein product [Dracunculus medinensis]|uniref:MARVEL domain-containing protein n=1 Tax=Dracunculus medinensis TaxID=318479 RepID=A0A0N4UB06_DRAME|nr:unnamed protein product [Dracunculus medinensis]
MDFNPRHPKWICCCCYLPTGLKILASIEVFVAATVLLAIIINMIIDFQEDVSLSWFRIFSILMCIFYGFSSSLLIIGILKSKVQLLYPTISARGVFVIFVQAFGITTIVNPQHHSSHEMSKNNNIKSTIHQEYHSSLSTAAKLLMTAFLMVLIAVFILYTIYLIVRCIRYVRANKVLENRRESIIMACQIGKLL